MITKTNGIYANYIVRVYVNTYWVIFKDYSSYEDNINGMPNSWFSVEMCDLWLHRCMCVCIHAYKITCILIERIEAAVKQYSDK